MPLSCPIVRVPTNQTLQSEDEIKDFSLLLSPDYGTGEAKAISPSHQNSELHPSSVFLEYDQAGELSLLIDTKRLTLRNVEFSDAENLYQHLFGNEVAMEKYADTIPYDMKRVLGRIEKWKELQEAGDPFGALVVHRRESEEFLGLVMISHGSKPGVAEIAYIFRQEAWGNGYGKEAACALVEHLAPLLRDHGYEIGGKILHALEATVRPDNPASGKILRRLGLTLARQEQMYGATRDIYVQDI